MCVGAGAAGWGAAGGWGQQVGQQGEKGGRGGGQLVWVAFAQLHQVEVAAREGLGARWLCSPPFAPPPITPPLPPAPTLTRRRGACAPRCARQTPQAGNALDRTLRRGHTCSGVAGGDKRGELAGDSSRAACGIPTMSLRGQASQQVGNGRVVRAATHRGQGLSPRVGWQCHSIRSDVIHSSSLVAPPPLASAPPKMNMRWFTCAAMEGCGPHATAPIPGAACMPRRWRRQGLGIVPQVTHAHSGPAGPGPTGPCNLLQSPTTFGSPHLRHCVAAAQPRAVVHHKLAPLRTQRLADLGLAPVVDTRSACGGQRSTGPPRVIECTASAGQGRAAAAPQVACPGRTCTQCRGQPACQSA